MTTWTVKGLGGNCTGLVATSTDSRWEGIIGSCADGRAPTLDDAWVTLGVYSVGGSSEPAYTVDLPWALGWSSETMRAALLILEGWAATHPEVTS